jgi:hypothetical protein
MNPVIAEALAPFRPLTYTEHYYVDLGYQHELGKANEHEYKRAQAEGTRGAPVTQQRRDGGHDEELLMVLLIALILGALLSILLDL